jgi:23S rRNA pseudouridine2605 synthase
MIDRGRKGSFEGRVLTQPAQIRMVRDADNPWYEVTLTEGRNRQIRKLFEEIGHFVEKIRRVEYGPLVLDLPPGGVRELTAEEVLALQRAARGIPSKKAVGKGKIALAGRSQARPGRTAGAARRPSEGKSKPRKA